MKKNLILSIVSLCLASMLMVFMAFAWYTTNSGVKSSVVINVTGGSDCSYRLQYYDATEDDWIDVGEAGQISFDKFDPGDAMYFRFVVASSRTENSVLQAKYNNYSTTKTNDIDIDVDDKVVYYSGVAIFDITENTDTATKTTYPYCVQIENETVYLITATGNYIIVDDYKMEKAMNSYNLGSSEEDLLPNELPAFSTLTAQTLDDYIFGSGGTTIYASTLTYAYFAIEYENFESSSSTGKYLSNNYFVYQSFSIETINIYL